MSIVSCQSGIQANGEALILEVASCHARRKRKWGNMHPDSKFLRQEIIARAGHLTSSKWKIKSYLVLRGEGAGTSMKSNICEKS